MKKRYHIVLIGAYILIVLIGVIWHAGGASAEDTIKLTVNSHSKSTAVMSNMQPGDESTSQYTVINEGSEPFDYFVDFDFLSGDVELYNILQMTLQKEGVILYSGVMSQAAGRVAIGSLPGGEEEAIQMDVIFPAEAGNEFQGKTVSVAFNFSASASPEPSTEPSPTPSTSTSPEPSTGASPTPSASISPEPSTSPSSVPTGTSIPGGSQPPASSPSPSASSAVTAAPGTDEVTVTDAPVPLGGDSSQATSSPAAGGITTGSPPSSSPDSEVTIDDDELPLSAPDGGDKLPDTAEPWYNLILISMAVTILSIIVLRRLNSKK